MWLPYPRRDDARGQGGSSVQGGGRGGMPAGVPATLSWQSTSLRSPLAAFFTSVRVAKGHSESVAREPCPRCGEIEVTRLAASVAPDHPTTATACADHAEIGVTPREIERRALSQRHREPRRQHPGDSVPARARHDRRRLRKGHARFADPVMYGADGRMTSPDEVHLGHSTNSGCSQQAGRAASGTAAAPGSAHVPRHGTK